MSAFTEPLAQILAALERDSEDPAAFAAFARVERLAADMETTLERVRENARSWHGNDGVGTGHARALDIIAEWCDAVLSAREEGADTR